MEKGGTAVFADARITSKPGLLVAGLALCSAFNGTAFAQDAASFYKSHKITLGAPSEVAKLQAALAH